VVYLQFRASPPSVVLQVAICRNVNLAVVVC